MLKNIYIRTGHCAILGIDLPAKTTAILVRLNMLHLLQLHEPLIQMDEGWAAHIFSRKCSLNESLLLLGMYHIPQVYWGRKMVKAHQLI